MSFDIKISNKDVVVRKSVKNTIRNLDKEKR